MNTSTNTTALVSILGLAAAIVKLATVSKEVERERLKRRRPTRRRPSSKKRC